MSTKIPKMIHLSTGQWRMLVSMMEQFTQSSIDPSIRRVAEIVEKVAKSS